MGPPRQRAGGRTWLGSGERANARLVGDWGANTSSAEEWSSESELAGECLTNPRWMIKEQKRLFVKEYETTTTQYQNLSRT